MFCFEKSSQSIPKPLLYTNSFLSVYNLFEVKNTFVIIIQSLNTFRISMLNLKPFSDSISLSTIQYMTHSILPLNLCKQQNKVCPPN